MSHQTRSQQIDDAFFTAISQGGELDFRSVESSVEPEATGQGNGRRSVGGTCGGNEKVHHAMRIPGKRVGG